MDETTATKVCCRCGDEKPRTAFYARSRAYDGLTPACKECLAQRRRERQQMTERDRQAELEAIVSRTSKMCGKCGTEKDRGSFATRSMSRDGMAPWCKSCQSEYGKGYYEQRRDDVLVRSREWYTANAEARKVSRDAWRRANLDRERERGKAWRARQDPGVLAASMREWRSKNIEHARERDRQWREANRERLRELGRAQYAADPLKFVEREHQRRAAVRDRSVGPVDYAALWTGTCGLCDEPMDPDLKHPDPLSKSVDHIVPLARGGSHTQDNLQWAHLVCNTRKGARPTG